MTPLWQLPVGWELHHAANDRIIMKCFTSDVLECRARCQGTNPARCSAWRILYNSYPPAQRAARKNITWGPLFSFFFFNFMFERRDPASGGAGEPRAGVKGDLCLERPPAASGCWPWARTRAWDLARDAVLGTGGWWERGAPLTQTARATPRLGEKSRNQLKT